MQNTILDRAITDALHEMTRAHRPTGDCRENIRRQVLLPERKEHNMKRFGIKRLAVAAAVCCFFVGTMAIAGGGEVKTRLKSDTLFDREKTYEALPELKEKAGIDPLTVEAFANGYAVRSASLTVNTDLDADDNVVNKYYGIDLHYEREGSPYIFLSTEPQLNKELEADDADIQRSSGEVLIVGSEDYYLGLPAGEAPEAEELERVETDPHFYISDGFEERTEYTVRGVSFVKDGIFYQMGSFDNDLTLDEMLDMAEELIASGEVK